MPITNPKEIRLSRRNELEAIIGHPPGWSLRWGMTVLFGCLVLLLGISWAVNYPDIVEAPVVLTTQNPPIRLVAGASAKIASLNISNGAKVRKNEVLGILDNPANASDILLLDELLEDLNKNDPSTYLATELPPDLQLGSIQPAYALFSQNFSDLQYFLKQDINYLIISNLRRQIVEVNKLEASLNRQIALFENELVLSQNGVSRDSHLLLDGSLSQLDFENTKSVHLFKSRQLERLRSEAASSQLQVRQLEAQILELRQKQSDHQNDHLLTIKGDIQRLSSVIDEWKQKWLLVSPINGEVAFTNAWSEQQFVKEGEEVLTIVPNESAGDLIAKAQLNGIATGKIKKGMEVQIRLAGYPYQEFGVLNGQLSRLSPVPSNTGYEAEISLLNGLTTSYKKEVSFQQEMSGVARIITEERSLLTRVLEKIWAAIEQ